MNILVAESGGTKTDWALTSSQDGLDEIQTRGCNPSLLDIDAIADIFSGPVQDWLAGRVPEAVYFFGAGLGRPGGRMTMRTALRESLGLTCPVHVQSDLMGAAYACLGRERGVIAIMGTGSAAVRYDGQSITDRRGGFGYLIGDEGAGVDMGRTLIRRLVDGSLGEGLEEAYLQFSGVDRTQVLEALYTHENPIQFLAGQVPFLVENKHQQHIKQLLEERIRLCLKTYVLPLVRRSTEKIVFMGGVARIFSETLEQLCEELSLANTRVLRESPIRAIVRFLNQQPPPPPATTE